MNIFSNKQQKPFPFETADPTELAWLAGLFQAEAHFFVDKRVRSQSKDSDYTPPPPTPGIRIEMIEEDVMNQVGKLVDQKVNPQVRKTTANNQVYRVTIQSRAKVEALLRCLFPYIIGEKTRTKIMTLLKLCDEYNLWLENGGRRKAAQLAARASAKKKKDRESTSE